MNGYDEMMDPECILLCDALNSIFGLETIESCCGHGREPYRVFFKVKDLHGLRVLGRLCSRNYSSGLWRVVVDNSDSPSPDVAYAYLESIHPLTPDDMALMTAALEESLRYWSPRIP